MTNFLDILSRSASEVTSDHAAHHKVLTAITLEANCSYIDAYTDFARATQTAAGGSVYSVAESIGLNPARLAEDIRTLETADQEKEKLSQRIVKMLDTAGATAGDGSTVMTGNPREMGPAIDDETYSAIRSQHPKPVWTRLRRMHRLAGGELYHGEHGERQFADEDQLWAQAGSDLVAQAAHGQ
jgi:hypothetical protein